MCSTLPKIRNGGDANAFLDKLSKGNIQNCRFIHRDVNCNIVSTSEKSGTNHISNNGGIKQMVEYPYNKGSYNH